MAAIGLTSDLTWPCQDSDKIAYVCHMVSIFLIWFLQADTFCRLRRHIHFYIIIWATGPWKSISCIISTTNRAISMPRPSVRPWPSARPRPRVRARPRIMVARIGVGMRVWEMLAGRVGMVKGTVRMIVGSNFDQISGLNSTLFPMKITNFLVSKTH